MATTFWGILAILAIGIWALVFYQSKVKNQPSAKGHKEAHAKGKKILSNGKLESVWKRKAVWLLVIALGAHLFMYYAITAWLPTYYIDTTNMNNTAAGIAASVFQICSLFGAFGVPALAAIGKLKNPILLTSISCCWVVSITGLLVMPGLWILWSWIGGIAQGGCFTLILMIMIEQSYDEDDNRKVSSVIQSFVYPISSLGPIIIGYLYEYFGQWTAGFITLIIVSIFLLLSSVFLWTEKPRLYDEKQQNLESNA